MKILLLDDESASLKYLTRLVEKTEPDAKIRGFQNMEEALLSAAEEIPDIAFLDIELGSESGITAARQLKKMNPKINIIFFTAYERYAVKAVSLHSSGYLVKPADEEDIRRELDNLLYPPQEESNISAGRNGRIYAKTFGNFDLFVNGKPVSFTLSKAKEMLAYLVDRDGASVNRKELAGILFEEQEYNRQIQNYLSKIYQSLKKSLENVGAGELICKGSNQYYLDTNLFVSDLQEYRKGSANSINRFRGEYMNQYSWAEDTLSQLYNEFHMYQN